MSEFSNVVSVLSLASSIIGWIVVHNLTKSRELRKEIRSKVDGLLRNVDFVKSYSLDYFFEEDVKKRVPSEHKIYNVFEDLSVAADDLTNNHGYNGINILIDQFYDLVTGAKGFSVQDADSPALYLTVAERDEILQSIRERVRVIKREIENWFTTVD